MFWTFLILNVDKSKFVKLLHPEKINDKSVMFSPFIEDKFTFAKFEHE
jgi:hypothetical protein